MNPNVHPPDRIRGMDGEVVSALEVLTYEELAAQGYRQRPAVPDGPFSPPREVDPEEAAAYDALLDEIERKSAEAAAERQRRGQPY